jgi:hypothetical protein
VRFQLGRFTVSIKELAESFGQEVARIVVDERLPPRWLTGIECHYGGKGENIPFAQHIS